MWIAQTSGGGADLTSVATLVTQLGLSAVFLWLYWTERKERQALQETMLAFMQKFGPALEASTGTLEKVQAGLTNQLDRSVPDQRMVDLSLRRMELMLDDLGSKMRQSETRRRREDYDDDRLGERG